MRNRIIAIAGVLLLVFTVACAGISPIYHSVALADQPPTDGSGIMSVWYIIDTDEYLWWCDLTAVITNNGDVTWDIESPQVGAKGVSQADVGYDFYKYEPIPYAYNGTVADLYLQDVTAEDLPHSQHIGRLDAVNTASAKPATITRKWHGIEFQVQCLVSQSVVDMWWADTLNVEDYVIVSFIDEHPNESELNLAVVVDKVYDSWSE